MITIREQSKLSEEIVGKLNLEGFQKFPPQQLAFNKDIDGQWWSSYIIGVTEINGFPIEVLPKLENLDFMSLFSFALMYQPSSEYFSTCYDINWDKEISVDADLYNILSPLLIMQYLNVLDKLVVRGLKRDYITIKENLHSKIKGKVKSVQNWKINTLKKKEDYFYCQYQVFSPDIPINRLLKKALDISFQLLGNIRSRSQNLKGTAFLSSKLKLINAFRNIRSENHIGSIRNYKFDKLNIHYAEAIRLAKCIIKHQDNSLTNNYNKKKRVPLFWIDMSRLYEVYVLGLLQNQYPDQILFQVKGSYGTRCDYIHKSEGIIMDAKYKLWYSSPEGRGSHLDSMIADIREISAYARDERLLSVMKKEEKSPACIIIFPDNRSTNLESELFTTVRNNKLDDYKDFYLLGIDLPRL